MVPPNISAGGNTTFCLGGSVQLTGNPVGGVWNTGQTSSSITVNQSGIYYTSIINNCGAVYSDTITVTVNGFGTPTITNNAGVLTSSIPTNNQWYLNNDLIPGATGTTFTPLVDARYKVILTGAGSCPATSNIINLNVTNTCNNIGNYLSSYSQSILTVPAPQLGYVTGHNGYNDKAKAEKISGIAAGSFLYGTFIRFGEMLPATSSSTFNVTVWDNSGTGGNPGAIIATKTVLYSAVNGSFTSGYSSYIEFSAPVAVSGTIYIGVELEYLSGDQLAIYASTQGTDVAAGQGTAWELFSNNTWHPFNGTASWGLDVSLHVNGVICDGIVTTIKETQYDENSIQIFPNPTHNLIQIEASALEGKMASIYLYDALGQLVFEKNEEINSGQISTSFSLENLNVGIYYLSIQSKNSNSIKKVLKQ
jgi:hypothetical protein